MADNKYDPAKMADLITKHHGNLSAVAKAMKCSRQTVHTYVNTYADVKAALEDARQEVLDIAESKLLTAIRRGDAWAICFFLKTQGKERGYVERQEMTGKNGGPIVTRSMTDAELERIAAGSSD